MENVKYATLYTSAFKPFSRNSSVLQQNSIIRKLEKIKAAGVTSKKGPMIKKEPKTEETIDKRMLGEVRMGRWKESEEKLFLEAMELYGNSWEKVKAHIGTRTTAQIRSHAQKYYAGLIKKAIKKYKEDPKAEKAIFVVVREYLNTSTIKQLSSIESRKKECSTDNLNYS
eukprot:TRINITY_DN1884_c0_g3_i1.p1 TRINITY_DN1884_c0_g3~~TRINITY_DN1884_c0_g3_i1.p1  ORF type:complete len:170 (-),score=37.06 TRINITY_DN1884_c0_g3_i1:139-648(-)